MPDSLKAIVLCAGEGTRLRPLTFSKPKHMLPVAGRPLLDHVLEALAEARISEVGLVVGHHPEAVQQYVGDGDQWGISATYIVQDQPLGLAHAVKQAQWFVDDDPFVVYLGDNLLEHGIREFVDGFRSDGMHAAMMLKRVEDPRRYGVAVLGDGRRVVRLIEKPSKPPSDLAVVGVYAFQPVIFEAIDNITPSTRGELELTDAIEYLVRRDYIVSATIVEGFWEDAGEPLALLQANRLLLDISQGTVLGSLSDDSVVEGNAWVGKGTRITGSRIMGPCIIGRNCVVEGSTIGPYASVGDGCVISGSRVEDSVLQDNCRVLDLPAGLKTSVLGENVQVIGDNSNAGGAMHLILGDMAQIRML